MVVYMVYEISVLMTSTGENDNRILLSTSPRRGHLFFFYIL